MTEQVVPPALVQPSTRMPLWIGTGALLVLSIGAYLYWQGDESTPPRLRQHPP